MHEIDPAGNLLLVQDEKLFLCRITFILKISYSLKVFEKCTSDLRFESNAMQIHRKENI